jgi:3-hydroxyisobutyrate dehydrogenase-like beta-hydroxyacid dehydrogenase
LSEVTIIGLGAMGSSIANAFVVGGHDVTVWNRSADKMIPFADAGINCAANPQEAVAAGRVIVICIDDYAATRELFEQHNLDGKISDRILVQFSTGTPQEARDSEKWVLQQNAQYLDGAIFAYPREVGHDGLFAVSGSQETYNDVESLLSALSSDIRYVGPPVGSAAALDVALLSYYVCTHLGLIHGALVCESENVRPDLLTALIVDSMPSDLEEIQHLGKALQTGDFGNPGASIGVYSGVLDRILDQARDASVNAEIAEFADSLYKRGIAAGLEQQEVVALTQILRNEP